MGRGRGKTSQSSRSEEEKERREGEKKGKRKKGGRCKGGGGRRKNKGTSAAFNAKQTPSLLVTQAEQNLGSFLWDGPNLELSPEIFFSNKIQSPPSCFHGQISSHHNNHHR